jgi:hypothetical protein
VRVCVCVLTVSVAVGECVGFRAATEVLVNKVR